MPARLLLCSLVVLVGCSEQRDSASPSSVTPKLREEANAVLGLVRRAVAAFPPATARLPPCTPGTGVRVLALPTADVLTGGKGSGDVPGFARPRGDQSAFDDLKRDDVVDRGVRILGDLRGLALFAADHVEPPKVSSTILSSAGRIDGRVVVFDRQAAPTCMSKISVAATPLSLSYVRKNANAADIDRKMTYDHEQALLAKLTTAVNVVVKAGETPSTTTP